jgi:hypothetical protein
MFYKVLITLCSYNLTCIQQEQVAYSSESYLAISILVLESNIASH